MDTGLSQTSRFHKSKNVGYHINDKVKNYNYYSGNCFMDIHACLSIIIFVQFVQLLRSQEKSEIDGRKKKYWREREWGHCLQIKRKWGDFVQFRDREQRPYIRLWTLVVSADRVPFVEFNVSILASQSRAQETSGEEPSHSVGSTLCSQVS